MKNYIRLTSIFKILHLIVVSMVTTWKIKNNNVHRVFPCRNVIYMCHYISIHCCTKLTEFSPFVDCLPIARKIVKILLILAAWKKKKKKKSLNATIFYINLGKKTNRKPWKKIKKNYKEEFFISLSCKKLLAIWKFYICLCKNSTNS